MLRYNMVFPFFLAYRKLKAELYRVTVTRRYFGRRPDGKKSVASHRLPSWNLMRSGRCSRNLQPEFLDLLNLRNWNDPLDHFFCLQKVTLEILSFQFKFSWMHIYCPCSWVVPADRWSGSLQLGSSTIPSSMAQGSYVHGKFAACLEMLQACKETKCETQVQQRHVGGFT